MPYQVDDATRHVMYGTELSRVRTELRLLLREHINQNCSRREQPTLLCNQVKLLQNDMSGEPTYQATKRSALPRNQLTL